MSTWVEDEGALKGFFRAAEALRGPYSTLVTHLLGWLAAVLEHGDDDFVEQRELWTWLGASPATVELILTLRLR